MKEDEENPIYTDNSDYKKISTTVTESGKEK